MLQTQPDLHGCDCSPLTNKKPMGRIGFLRRYKMAKPKLAWDRHSILAELRRKGMTLTALAELTGVSPGGFRTIWTRPNAKAEKAISEFLDVPAEELFPDRYPKRRATILAPEYQAEAGKAAA